MFRRKKRNSTPAYDITKKVAKTWWGGTKLVPTTKAEQQIMRAEILRNSPDAVIIDSKAKKEKELEWIDRVEELDAFLSE